MRRKVGRMVERAVDDVLDQGLRTPDLFTDRQGERRVDTATMGEALAHAIRHGVVEAAP